MIIFLGQARAKRDAGPGSVSVSESSVCCDFVSSEVRLIHKVTEAQHVKLVLTQVLKPPALMMIGPGAKVTTEAGVTDGAWCLLRVIRGSGGPGGAVRLGCCVHKIFYVEPRRYS